MPFKAVKQSVLKKIKKMCILKYFYELKYADYYSFVILSNSIAHLT